MPRGGTKQLAVVQKQMREFRLTDSPGVGEDRIKNRSQITW